MSEYYELEEVITVQREGVVTAKSPHGIMLDNEDNWLNWSKEEYRHGDWEADAVKKGDAVLVEVDEGGKWIASIKVTSPSQDVTPAGISEPGEARDGQYRSPADFRRTSALAQSVAFHAQDATPSVTEVIKTASQMEKYLEGGYERQG